MTGTPCDLAAGGVCAWRLPPDASGPRMARSLLLQTMTALDLPPDTIESGRLAVSEVATNAFSHAMPESGSGPVIAPELWIYARSRPSPSLVVSVFDGLPAAAPQRSGEDLLAESGKGIGIIDAITMAWGSRLSRSRLASPLVNGKAVWFTLPLPERWPGRSPRISPSMAAGALHQTLAARGIPGTRHDDATVSMLELPAVNVWIEPQHYAWHSHPGHQIRHPLLDLQEVTDQLIDHLARMPGPPRWERGRVGRHV